MKKFLPILVFYCFLLPFSGFGQVPNKAGIQDKTQEPEKPDAPAGKLEVATFAGGCFWCTEAYFEKLKGVQRVISGYCGGKEKNPTYQQVSNGQTGHAESVQVFYDPEQISYNELLKVHFATHDPTTIDRQGPDVGNQYRSVVFYHNQQQKALAENYIAGLNLSGKYKGKIVTQVVPFSHFYEAEKYHQDYYRLNPNDPYVTNVARPKVKKFETEFRSSLKKVGKD